MSKRDLAFVSATADADLEPRTKRRKDTKSVEKEDVPMDDATTSPVENGGQANGVSNEEVKEQGLALWQIVKDVVDKECVRGNCDSRRLLSFYLLPHLTYATSGSGRLLSYEFMRLPSKRQYPDYYELIKRPISLDEIKKGIDHGSYHSLEQIKEDIVHCFTNAKKYNQKESAIWLDAKFLHVRRRPNFYVFASTHSICRK
jgi:chromatin structure-remodeling complex subunit RSC4